MMSVLHAASYAALLFAFAFVTLSLASGLLWLAEIIEEHSQIAKIVGKRMIYCVIAFHAILYFTESNLPLKHVLFSIICHLVYLTNFLNFPVISLTSLSFIISCILVIVNHFVWFFHWSFVVDEARRASRRWRHPAVEPAPVIPSFVDMATFFGICVWLIPLFLFLSLTANDNTLPTSIQISTDDKQKAPRQSLFVSISSKMFRILPGRFRRKEAGIIAPISIPSRPLSPVDGHLSPTYQRPGSPAPYMGPPKSPTHHQRLSPTGSTFSSTSSWVPVDGASGTSSRPSSPPGTRDDSNVRKRIALQAPPFSRTTIK